MDFSYRQLMLCGLLLHGVTGLVMADEATIRVSPVTIGLIRECEVPSHDSGVLVSLIAKEGMLVSAGDELAKLESRQQELSLELATLSYEVAKEEALNDLAILAAEEGLKEAQQKLATLEISLKVARNIAENKSALEIARTDESTAQIQLDRAKTAKERFDSSVSDAELTRLSAQFRKAELSVAEAISKQFTSELQVQVHEAEMSEQQAAISRQKHLVEQERKKLKQAAQIAETRRLEMELSRTLLERRKVASPISGVVTRLHHQQGEFVEAGTPILRLIQLDKLRAEGFVDVPVASPLLKNRKVRIEMSGVGGVRRAFDGVVAFVGQEVDPLNQQVRVWAEFESPGLDVYPGMTAEMMILPELASLAESDTAGTGSSSAATILKTAPKKADASQIPDSDVPRNELPGGDGSNDSAEPR